MHLNGKYAQIDYMVYSARQMHAGMWCLYIVCLVIRVQCTHIHTQSRIRATRVQFGI